ncbi:hypothetical protein QO034_23265, partial [Sedimentitalea sp. JM2-8]
PMSITPSLPDRFRRGSVFTWVNSQWKIMGLPGHFSAEINSFYLLNQGNAINFAHNNVLGSFIYLVACELTLCIAKISRDKTDFRNDRISTLNTSTRQEIANKWLMEFNDAGA